MKTVRICGILHQIIDKEYIEGDGTVCGEITYSECVIKMRAGINPDYYNQTLIHEVVHGMLVMIGRNDLSEDETFVQTLALAISQTFELKTEVTK